MSELLQNWLNNEVGLSTNVTNFEKDFANGYLFGEVLHKFRQQDDFGYFENKNTYEAKLANFKRLEPTLKALGIKFNATQANAMMAGERGSSLRLLYQLKMATERLLFASSASGPQNKGATQAMLGGGVTKSIRIPRESHDNHEKRFLEHRLRATCFNVKEARVAKVTKKFEEERQKQEAVALEMDKVDQMRIAEQREIHRIGLQARRRQNEAAKDEWTMQSLELWGKNMEKRAEREKREIDFANRTHQARLAHTRRAEEAATAEVRNGIDAFEGSLANLGIMRLDDDDNSENQLARPLAQTVQATHAKDFFDELQAKMPSSDELEQEAAMFLRKIKESKNAGGIARDERERRRRRVLVEQQREQDVLEESKHEEVLLEKLSRESVEEKRISYSVWRTRQYEEVILRNRELREKQYREQKKADKQDALRRDRELLDEMLETMREQEERERVRYRAIEHGRQAQTRAQLSEDCEEILDLISEMALAALQQEQLTNSDEVDETLWREWMALFVENVSVQSTEPRDHTMGSMYPLTALSPQLDSEGEPASILDDAAIRDYIECCGQWEPHVRKDSETVETSEGSVVSKDGICNTLGKSDPQAVRLTSVCDLDAEVVRAVDEEAPTLSFANKLKREPDIVGGRPVNYRLGVVVAALLDRRYAQPPLPQPPPMPAVPIRLVLSGKPFSGKKTLAARLSEAYNLKLVDMGDVVRECLLLSKRPDLGTQAPIDVLSFTTETADDYCQQCEDAGNPYVKQLQSLGYDLQQLLDQAQVVHNELYVQLAVTKIRSLFPDKITVEMQGSALDDHDGSAAVGKGGGADRAATTITGNVPRSSDSAAIHGDPENVRGEAGTDMVRSDGDDSVPDRPASSLDGTVRLDDPAVDAIPAGEETDHSSPETGELQPEGWILLGFPGDMQQLALLERFLSGWVVPSARPAADAEIHKSEAALLAPRPPEDPPAFERKPGGYDLHIRLDVAGEEAVRRAVGRRVDPATGLMYHLEDSPPCMKNQIIYERLVSVDSLTNSLGSLTHRIHQFDMGQPGAEEVLAHFGPWPDMPRLVSVDAGQSPEAVYDAVEEHVAILMDRKRTQIVKQLGQDDSTLEAGNSAVAAHERADLIGGGTRTQDGEPHAAVPAEDAGASTDEVVAEPSNAGDRDRTVHEDEQLAERAERSPTPEGLPQMSDLQAYVEGFEEAVFSLLLRQWQELQEGFKLELRRLSSWHRTHLADFRSGLCGIQQRFVQYLQRPDDKQDMVDAFVRHLNCFSEEYPDMRKQDSCKEEWHQRVEDLREQLEDKVISHQTECLMHLDAILQSQWVESQVEVVAAQVQHAIQFESRRYHAACQFLSDFYFSAMGSGLPPPAPSPPVVHVLGDADPVKEDVDAKDSKKKPQPKAAPKKDDEQEPETADLARASRLRRYEEAQEEGSHGRWVFPFLEELVTQATNVTWRLGEFTPPSAPPEKETEPVPKAKAKGRASPPPEKGKKGAAPVEEPAPVAQNAPPLFIDLQQASLAERLVYMHRLSVTRSWAERRLTQMSEAAKDTFAQLHDWVLLRKQKELDAVSELLDVLREHIESEELVTEKLSLQGSDLHRHPNVLLKAPRPPPPPPMLEAAAHFRWTVQQLDGLLELISGVARAGHPDARTVTAQSLSTALSRLTQTHNDAREPPQIPQCWQKCDIERLQCLCTMFDQSRTGTIDCVEFLLHIGLMHSPLGWPSLQTLLKVRHALEHGTPPRTQWPDLWISEADLGATPLFEDPGGAEVAFQVKHKLATAEEPVPVDRACAQLKWVARVLQRFRAPHWKRQAWELAVAWHDYGVRCEEDSNRWLEVFDDVKSSPGSSPHPPLGPDVGIPDLMVSAGVPEMPGTATTTFRPPRPELPADLPEFCTSESVSVRQLLTYLCQGSSLEDGLYRAIAVLGPADAAKDRDSTWVSLADLYPILLQLGARPTPPPGEGDEQPALPTLPQLQEELRLEHSDSAGAVNVAELLASPHASQLLARLGIVHRHSRLELERLFPRNLKAGARMPPGEIALRGSPGSPY